MWFEASRFIINWEMREATCPEKRTSRSWTPSVGRQKNPVIRIKFAMKECVKRPSRAHCAGQEMRRTLIIKPEPQRKSLQAARAREQTPEHAKQCAQSAGIEGTILQAVRGLGARRCRYLGAAKARLQLALTATALHFVRIANSLTAISPQSIKR